MMNVTLRRALSFAVVVMAVGSCMVPMGNMQGRQAQAQADDVQRLCTDLNYAYESGVNSGQQRRVLDTSWAYQCDPAWQAQLRDTYQRGYNLGLANAPLVVQAPPRYGYGYGNPGYPGQAPSPTVAGGTCRFSSDCGQGQSCRRDSASGAEVCMGGGYAGDACWFSSDCTSGRCDSNRCE